MSKLDAEFVMLAIGVPMTLDLGEAITGTLDRLRLHPGHRLECGA